MSLIHICVLMLITYRNASAGNNKLAQTEFLSLDRYKVYIVYNKCIIIYKVVRVILNNFQSTPWQFLI